MRNIPFYDDILPTQLSMLFTMTKEVINNEGVNPQNLPERCFVMVNGFSVAALVFQKISIVVMYLGVMGQSLYT